MFDRLKKQTFTHDLDSKGRPVVVREKGLSDLTPDQRKSLNMDGFGTPRKSKKGGLEIGDAHIPRSKMTLAQKIKRDLIG